jgi:hypothetical protein
MLLAYNDRTLARTGEIGATTESSIIARSKRRSKSETRRNALAMKRHFSNGPGRIL